MTGINDILALCDRAASLAPKEFPPTLAGKPTLLGAPEWYSFEHEAWPLGEAIRQALATTPCLKKDRSIQEAIVRVIENRNLRRGRQSFVMALAHSKAHEMKSRIAPFLSDPDIDGQVVDALYKMRAFEFQAQVRPLLESDKTWIRNKAKRYLQKSEAPQPPSAGSTSTRANAGRGTQEK